YTAELNRRSHSPRISTPGEHDEEPPHPFKLLDYYEVQDAPIFYARDEETDALLKLVTSNRLVIVTGPSGAGKTSLLKAGLIANINRQHPYRGVYVRLMEDPVGELVGALEGELDVEVSRPSGDRVLDRRQIWEAVDGMDALPVIVFDQGEELFTRFESTMR